MLRPPRRGDRLRPVPTAAGVEAHLGRTAGCSSAWRVVKSPGVPGRAGGGVARDAGSRCRRARAGLAPVPDRFVAVTGTNGKTTTVELLGAVYRGPGWGSPWPATWARRSRRWWGRSIPARWWSARLELPAGGHARVRARAAVLSTSRRTTWTATGRSRLCAREAADVRPSGRGGRGGGAAEIAGGGAARTFGDAGSDLERGTGASCGAASPCCGRRDPLARRAQPRERDGGRRRGAGLGRAGGGCDRGAAHLRRRAAPARGGRDRRGVLYVNDSKATNVAAARRGIEAFAGGVHAILGGSLKGGGFEGLREAVSARCRACYLIGEAAERLERDLAGSAPLVRSGICRRRWPPPRRRPARARWCCCPGLRQLRPIPRLRGARRAFPSAGDGARIHVSARSQSGCLRAPPASARSSIRSSTQPRCVCWPLAK